MNFPRRYQLHENSVSWGSERNSQRRKITCPRILAHLSVERKNNNSEAFLSTSLFTEWLLLGVINIAWDKIQFRCRKFLEIIFIRKIYP